MSSRGGRGSGLRLITHLSIVPPRMAKVRMNMSMSLDGYAAGPDQSEDDPLCKGGIQLHEKSRYRRSSLTAQIGKLAN